MQTQKRYNGDLIQKPFRLVFRPQLQKTLLSCLTIQCNLKEEEIKEKGFETEKRANVMGFIAAVGTAGLGLK